jgi:TolB-like protein/class 3 adenylate cyclase/tetratricopeptide (TPR) repeat protein
MAIVDRGDACIDYTQTGSEPAGAARQQQSLSVVMFADLVGYTTIVREDESRARRARAAMRSILETTLPRHGGKLAQTYGDGALGLFGSAVGAARAAVELHRRLASETGEQLRIGLDLGEVAWDVAGPYGDAVNVAARLQSIAGPGSVLVSYELARQLRAQRELPTTPIGDVFLKNVEQPIRVHALAVDGLRLVSSSEAQRRAREGGGSAQSGPVERSVAVLPFANFSGEPSQEYFVAGMHEALITELARSAALKVISRTSVLRFADTAEPMTGIAEALGVDAVVEGSVLRDGPRVRITAQLIAVHPERHLWANSYDGDLSDVLGLHTRVAAAISDAVARTIGAQDAESRASTQAGRAVRPVDPDAYEAYLRGRYAAGKGVGQAALLESSRHFEAATAIDPSFPLAWVGLARTLGYLALFGHGTRDSTLEKASRAIARALALDAGLGEALAVRGYLCLVFDADPAGAVSDLGRAVEADPNNVAVLIDYGMALNALGSFREASDAFDRAAELDPLSPTTAMMRGWGRYVSRRFADARDALERAARMWPDFAYNHLWMAAACVALGEDERASSCADRAEELEAQTADVNFLSALSWIRAATGDIEDAGRIREHVVSLEGAGRAIDPCFRVLLDAAMGDDASAIEHLRAAIRARSPILFHMPGHPMLDTLHRHADYDRLLEEAGLGSSLRVPRALV